MRGGRQSDARGAIQTAKVLDRAVRKDGSGWLNSGKHSLRLAEAIGEQHTGLAGLLIGLPPAVDGGEHFSFGRPAIDRQTEGRFRDESMAANGFEGRAGG